MRLLPLQERQSRAGMVKLKTSVAGASAAVLSASMLFAGKAGSQEASLPAAPTLPVAPESAGMAAEPVLIASFGSEAPTFTATPAPVALSAPIIDPMTGAVVEAQGLVLDSPTPTYAPLSLAGPTVTAMSLVSGTQELAQNSAAPAAASGTFWPENHWEDNASSASWWDGIVSLGVSGGAVAMVGGGAWLLWRYINTEPSFDDAIVYLTFEESPCSQITATNPNADVVYTAPGKDDDGDDLIYSILEYDTDDSALMSIDSETGEVRFISDPLYFSPGDLNRDGTYKFVIQIEDEEGNTATQAVELTITRDSPNGFVQPFVQNGGTVCGDEFEITDSSGSPSLFDIAGGLGNDLAHVRAGTTLNFGVDLGSGNDTFFVNDEVTAIESVLVDLGDGRDTIDLDAHVTSLVVQNFDADDLIFVNGGVVGTDLGVTGDLDATASAAGLDTSDTALYTPLSPAMPVQIFASEADAVGHVTGGDNNELVAYHNGEHSFILIEDNAGAISTTIKLEDYILTDYGQIDVA